MIVFRRSPFRSLLAGRVPRLGDVVGGAGERFQQRLGADFDQTADPRHRGSGDWSSWTSPWRLCGPTKQRGSLNDGGQLHPGIDPGRRPCQARVSA
jgi:hypothetical protein